MRTTTQPTGMQGQQSQIWRQGAAAALQSGIQALETELQFQRRMLSEFTGGATRQGTAGGVSARRTTTRVTGGGTGGGGGSNTEWVTNLLRQHGNGLTPPEIKQMAIAAGRSIGKSYPYDSLRTLERNHTIRNQGGKYRLATTGGTGPVVRSGTARTRARARARKPIARAMAATG